MKNKRILFLLFIFFLAVLFFFFNSSKEIKSICINEKCFNVEIADENSERISGLSNRDSLNLDSGMLFIFEEETNPNFWMKEMKFPIDIIWIDENMKISGINKNLQPCIKDFCPTYHPEEKIKYVFEINSGLSENFGFEIGDKVKLIW